jgi:phage terminase small subunit
MARGGFRPNAGRRVDPNSARQKRIAAKAAKQKEPATKPEVEQAWPFPSQDKPLEPPADSEKPGSFATPLEYWQHVLEDPNASASAKHAAAYAMAPYVHPRLAPAAKKVEAKERAAKAATGRFTRKAPPRLVVNNP